MTNEYNIYEFVSEGKRIYVLYDTDNDDTGLFPIIESAYYLDDKGNKQDYELSRRMDMEHIRRNAS
jgi:hypothetical protein